MAIRYWLLTFVVAVFGLAPVVARSDDRDDRCSDAKPSRISFIEFKSPNIAVSPPALLTIKGKLSLPHDAGKSCSDDDKSGKRDKTAKPFPAVLILHGTSGVDSRGDFYQDALNAAGIATLQIDMWEARQVTGIANRPQLPILTYPDAFSALAFLVAHPSIDANRIGVIGFSWGGVVSLASAELRYSGLFGGGRTFKAHVANYPVCYGANNPALFPIPPAQAGTQLLNLTGAPVLIQIGSEDDYDNGTAHCRALAQTVNPSNNGVVEVAEYPGAYHAWDRIMIPVIAPDPFADEGSVVRTGVVPLVEIVPDVDQAYKSRHRVVKFFQRNLSR